MKKVLIISFFNSTNIGDRAICDVLTQEIEKIAQISKLDISGKLLADIDLVNAQREEVVKKSKFYNIKSVLSLRWAGRFNLARQLIKDCDVVLLAGGNMIMDLEPFSYYSFLCNKYVEIAKKMHKKVVFAFVGAGKVRTRWQSKRWKRALEKSDFITVRDSISKQFLIHNLGVRKPIAVWKDPVFVLERSRRKKRTKTVAINIYLDAVASVEEKGRLKNTYLYLIERIKKRYNVVLFSTEINDEPGVKDVYRSLASTDGVSVVLPKTLEELLSFYQEIDFILATRMHSFIIAITQSIPMIALAWEKKIYGVSADIGLSDVVFDIHKANEEKEHILADVCAILDEYDESVKRIEEISERVKADFIAYREQLKDILFEG